MGPQELGLASLVRPKRPTILFQPTDKISLLCGTWRNLPLTPDIKKLQKSLYLVNFSPIYGPQELGWAPLVRSKWPTISGQPTNKISLLYGT